MEMFGADNPTPNFSASYTFRELSGSEAAALVAGNTAQAKRCLARAVA